MCFIEVLLCFPEHSFLYSLLKCTFVPSSIILLNCFYICFVKGVSFVECRQIVVSLVYFGSRSTAALWLALFVQVKKFCTFKRVV